MLFPYCWCVARRLVLAACLGMGLPSLCSVPLCAHALSHKLWSCDRHKGWSERTPKRPQPTDIRLFHLINQYNRTALSQRAPYPPLSSVSCRARIGREALPLVTRSSDPHRQSAYAMRGWDRRFCRCSLSK